MSVMLVVELGLGHGSGFDLELNLEPKESCELQKSVVTSSRTGIGPASVSE
jgi:hypothetical protein